MEEEPQGPWQKNPKVNGTPPDGIGRNQRWSTDGTTRQDSCRCGATSTSAKSVTHLCTTWNMAWRSTEANRWGHSIAHLIYWAKCYVWRGKKPCGDRMNVMAVVPRSWKLLAYSYLSAYRWLSFGGCSSTVDIGNSKLSQQYECPGCTT